MKPVETQQPEASRWGSRHAIDALVSALTLALGLAMMFDSHRIGSGWDDGQLQSGYFPFRLGAIIAVASLAIFIRALAATVRGPGQPFVRWPQFRPVVTVFAGTLLYVATIPWVGIYAATGLLIAGFMRTAGRFGWLATVAIAVSTPAVLFVLFEVVFLVPLPKGPLESLLGY